MLVHLSILAALAAQAFTQDTSPNDLMVVNPFAAEPCRPGVKPTKGADVYNPIYNGSYVTSIKTNTFTSTIDVVLTETTVVASVKVSTIGRPRGPTISFLPVPVPEPSTVWITMNTTSYDYAYSVTTTTRVKPVRAYVSPIPYRCVIEGGKPPRLALPGNKDELCGSDTIPTVPAETTPTPSNSPDESESEIELDVEDEPEL